MQEKILVKFDPLLLANLHSCLAQDYKLPAIDNPTDERLLLIAAFCIAEVALSQNEGGETYRCEKRAEAATDAVGQLSRLYERMVEGSIDTRNIITIEGKSNG